jgi:hypothetical protein
MVNSAQLSCCHWRTAVGGLGYAACSRCHGCTIRTVTSPVQDAKSSPSVVGKQEPGTLNPAPFQCTPISPSAESAMLLFVHLRTSIADVSHENKMEIPIFFYIHLSLSILCELPAHWSRHAHHSEILCQKEAAIGVTRRVGLSGSNIRGK